MAHVIGPDFVALQVKDLEKSRIFYTELLGFEEAPQCPPGAILFKSEPIPFAIRTPLIDLNATTHRGWGTVLWFSCVHADELHDTLERNGIKITQQPFDGPFGRTFSFEDPDGYVLTMHENNKQA
ncbi:VOC family protein [Alicyclobacillus fastidiosus]|uniref:VOC family protein n=1 Tax=Alicyclobacillus fastidiosus TaxID=392011 RepID=A0ABY6ZFU5_9BACL|nr:VOC family protein [Alicyclobacillus fastidiosus]WAH41448.1 VOC family protein [Alicyclobacillus fastidiosus]GMA63081.1 glyoxalase [Alicyclobacillus fastidiosus]